MSKRVIRYRVFESNSSMSHSLVIMTEDDYDRWENEGLYVYTEDPAWAYKNAKLVPIRYGLYTKDECFEFLKGIGYEYYGNADDEDDYEVEEYLRDGGFITYTSWTEDEWEEQMEDVYFTTPSGDKMVVISKCGRDG